MTTVIRRRRASRMQIGPYRRHELLTGRIVYPVQGRKQQVVSTYVKMDQMRTGANHGSGGPRCRCPMWAIADSSDVRARETQCETRSNTPGKCQ